MSTTASVLIARVARALGTADAEQGMKEALSLLEQLGAQQSIDPALPAWIELTRGTRSIRLLAPTAAVEPDLTEALSSVLALGLLRAAEQAELPRIGERVEAPFSDSAGARGMNEARVRDVTERDRALELLAESEARFRDLVERTYDFVVISRQGVAVEIAGGFQRMLGYTLEEGLGKRLIDYVAPEWVSISARVLAEQRSGAYEIELISRTGEYVPVEIMGVNSTLGGLPVRVSGVRDLRPARQLERERRAFQDQLIRTQRLESLGVLAGGVAHDFNNLLVGVLGNAELLQPAIEKPEDRELCDTIIASARRAAALVSQLLVYAGRRELGPKRPVDLSALWFEVGALLESRVSKGAQIELDLAPDSVVLGDRTTLTQVLMNLLTNASDALEGAAGRIEVSARKISEPDSRWQRALGVSVGPGEWVQVEVRDTGTGMDRATLERIFEPFYSTKPNGHGLGLASVLGIVSAHGGAISVESEPGRGSRFSVLLPAAKL